MHTDLGIQYTSENFQNQLKKHGMVASFTRKGCPYDNACIESFHATLKKEKVYRNRYLTFETAKLALFSFEGWYSRKQIHGAINYLTPDEIERMCRAVQMYHHPNHLRLFLNSFPPGEVHLPHKAIDFQ